VKDIFKIEYAIYFLLMLPYYLIITLVSSPIDNSISYELDNALTGASFGTVIGFFMGAIPASKIAHNNFIDKNKASTFTTHFEAKVFFKLIVSFISFTNFFPIYRKSSNLL